MLMCEFIKLRAEVADSQERADATSPEFAKVQRDLSREVHDMVKKQKK